MAAVEVDGLTVRYGEVVAVDAVSFEAQAGQITAVLVIAPWVFATVSSTRGVFPLGFRRQPVLPAFSRR